MIEIDFAEITQDFFEQKCLAENRPCIIRNCENGLKIEFLKQALIFTEQCCRSDQQHLSRPETFPLLPPRILTDEKIHEKIAETEVDVETSFRVYTKMKLKELFEKCPGLLSSSSLGTSNNNHNWYLKDWHFAEFFEQEILGDANLHSTNPLYLLPAFMRRFAQDDVLQQFQRSQENNNDANNNSTSLPRKFGAGNHEYRFVYAGGKGSATLPHFDVCATYSWSLNLSGTKQWKFLSSSDINEKTLQTFFFGSDAMLKQHLLKEKGKFDALEDLFLVENKNNNNNDDNNNNIITTIIQNPGDIIFVPALRIHEVRNLTSCVSVNHNWYSMPYSIPYILRLISIESENALNMLGKETVDILKKSSSKEEWAQIFNLNLQGSSNWCLNVVKKFFEFCLMRKNDENKEEEEEKMLRYGLEVVSRLEKDIIG